MSIHHALADQLLDLFLLNKCSSIAYSIPDTTEREWTADAVDAWIITKMKRQDCVSLCLRQLHLILMHLINTRIGAICLSIHPVNTEWKLGIELTRVTQDDDHYLLSWFITIMSQRYMLSSRLIKYSIITWKKGCIQREWVTRSLHICLIRFWSRQRHMLWSRREKKKPADVLLGFGCWSHRVFVRCLNEMLVTSMAIKCRLMPCH